MVTACTCRSISGGLHDVGPQCRRSRQRQRFAGCRQSAYWSLYFPTISRGIVFRRDLGVMLGFLPFCPFAQPWQGALPARVAQRRLRSLCTATRMACQHRVVPDFRTDISNTRTFSGYWWGERLAEPISDHPGRCQTIFVNVPTSWRISNHQKTTSASDGDDCDGAPGVLAMVFANPDQQPLVLDPHPGSPWRNRH